jgi:hypothetical protein
VSRIPNNICIGNQYLVVDNNRLLSGDNLIRAADVAHSIIDTRIDDFGRPLPPLSESFGEKIDAGELDSSRTERILVILQLAMRFDWTIIGSDLW